MSKLKSKQDVIEWYWPDFLVFCVRSIELYKKDIGQKVAPTETNFWDWYITYGPMGLKHKSLFYTKEDVEYI